MRTFLTAAVLATAYAGIAFAQEIPNSAVDAAGQSTQTMSVLHDSVSATVSTGGVLDSRSGQASGAIGAGVSAPGIGVATNLDSAGPAETGSQNAGDTRRQGAGPQSGPGIAGDVQEGAAGAMSDARNTEQSPCGRAVGQPLGPNAIAALSSGTLIQLQPFCAEALLGAAGREALARNRLIEAFLKARGLRHDEVAAVTQAGQVVVLSVYTPR